MSVASLILAISGVVLLAVAYLVRVEKRLHLLAGFNPALVCDPDGLARWAGNGLFLLAAWTLAAALALPRSPALAQVYALGMIAGVAVVIHGNRRFSTHAAPDPAAGDVGRDDRAITGLVGTSAPSPSVRPHHGDYVGADPRVVIERNK